MFLVRLTSSLIAFAVFIFFMLIKGPLLYFAVMVIAVAALKEFYSALKKSGYKPLVKTGIFVSIMLFALLFLYIYRDNSFLSNIFTSLTGTGYLFVFFAVFVLNLLVFFPAVFRHEKYSLNDIALTVAGIVYIPLMLMFVPLTIYDLKNAPGLVWFIFAGAWATDTSAYITGITLGKHKLKNSVSPKKSVEGYIGGIAGCVVVTIILWYILRESLPGYNIIHFLLLGVICSVLGQFGDLVASSIKRYTGIKDYGSIMPGHGGVLDRFDSILFTAPAVYLFIKIIDLFWLK